MSVNTEAIQQDLTQLDDEQLEQVANFIAFLKFQGKYRRVELNMEQMRLLSADAGEDRALAEAGLDDYAAALAQEDYL
ncbi:MAG: hypothetical protein WBB01_04010 [Phormidesmis sp.]